MIKIKSIEQKNLPWIVAHRGYRAKFPENTISAFEGAINADADMIELDVCFSRDRVPVVIHDNTLERTTNGKGFVSEHTLSELKELDAGSWFSNEFKGETIPTLEELLLKIRGRIAVNIEIKPESFEDQEKIDSIEIQICNILERLELLESVLISSFEFSFFPRIQHWCIKNKKKKYLRIAPLQGVYQSNEFLVSLCKHQKAYSLNPDESFVTSSLINEIQKNGFKIFPYTINDFDRIENLISMGVNGIISDEPEMVREVIQNFKKIIT